MPNRTLTVEQILTSLADTPLRIAALTAGLRPPELRTRPDPGEWSANHVLAHLRACADVWGTCIVEILTQDKPTLRAVNPRTWIRVTDYLEGEFRPSLRAFARQRTRLLTVLKPLSSAEWSRTATVTGAGKPLERTALSYAQRLAHHEQRHLTQIERIVSTMHSSRKR